MDNNVIAENHICFSVAVDICFFFCNTFGYVCSAEINLSLRLCPVNINRICMRLPVAAVLFAVLQPGLVNKSRQRDINIMAAHCPLQSRLSVFCESNDNFAIIRCICCIALTRKKAINIQSAALEQINMKCPVVVLQQALRQCICNHRFTEASFRNMDDRSPGNFR